MATALGSGGAKLVLMARRLDALDRAAQRLRGQGIAVQTVACDLADIASSQRGAQAALALGAVDILVNAAGVNSREPFEEVSAGVGRTGAMSAAQTFDAVPDMIRAANPARRVRRAYVNSGGGAIGMRSALLLKTYGCADLTVAAVNPLRREQLQQHARVKTYDPKQSNPPDDSFDFVIDAVGSKLTRYSAFAAVRAGGVIMHVGLRDWASEIDVRRLTLAEITLLGTYTYTTADLRATVRLIHAGAFGDLSWVESRPLSEGAQAFAALHRGEVASVKVILRP